MPEEVKRLFTILEEGYFQPILQRSEENLPDDGHRLTPLKQRVEEQREHLRTCASDEELYEAYEEQISTNESEGLTRELRDLGLPTLADCREQFEATAATVFDTSVRQHSPSPWEPNIPSRP